MAAAFVSCNYASLAGLDLNNALAAETCVVEAKPYYTLIFATRDDRKDDPQIKKFISIYRSQPVKDFIRTKFNGKVAGLSSLTRYGMARPRAVPVGAAAAHQHKMAIQSSSRADLAAH